MTSLSGRACRLRTSTRALASHARSGSQCVVGPSAGVRSSDASVWSVRRTTIAFAEPELRHGLTAAFVRAGHFPQEARPAARRLPALAAAGRACRVLRDRPRLPQGPEALGRAALGGVAGLARDEGLRRVHLRRIRDADLFEDRSQVLAERVARLLGLPDVHDAESARAFAGCVGKDARDGPVRH